MNMNYPTIVCRWIGWFALMLMGVLMGMYLPGCRYAELPTASGTARYINIGFATKADKIRATTPGGSSLEIDGVQSDSAKAIDALAAIAKTAATK